MARALARRKTAQEVHADRHSVTPPYSMAAYLHYAGVRRRRRLRAKRPLHHQRTAPRKYSSCISGTGLRGGLNYLVSGSDIARHQRQRTRMTSRCSSLGMGELTEAGGFYKVKHR